MLFKKDKTHLKMRTNVISFSILKKKNLYDSILFILNNY